MYEYLIVDAMIILFPLLLSFDKRVHFFKKWKAYGMALLIVGGGYIIWDVIATARGHWSFNEEYITGLHLFGLPVEEILFFVTIPYACIFTYECLLYYVGDRDIRFRREPYLIAGIVCAISAGLFWHQEYTLIVLLVCAFMLIGLPFIAPELLRSRIYWFYIAITMGLFVMANYFLTSIPIVRYGSDAIWGAENAWQGRFITIPIEDFFYNFSMLTLYLAVFLWFKRRWNLD